MMARALTKKRKLFAEATVDGLNGPQAYSAAYGKDAGKNAKVRAWELRKNPQVAAYIAELQAKAEAPRTLARIRKRQLIAEMVEEKVAKKKQLTGEQIKAMELDCRIAGHFEPDKVEVFGLGELLALVRKKPSE